MVAPSVESNVAAHRPITPEGVVRQHQDMVLTRLAARAGKGGWVYETHGAKGWAGPDVASQRAT
jgi:hypothetical protein